MDITKQTVDAYKIRNAGKHNTWADITIDAIDKTDRISISSDYGNWANYWNSCGCGFYEFLCSLDKHYVAGKFGCDRYFDQPSTIAQWKLEVINCRKEDDIDTDKARLLYDEIIEIEVGAFDKHHVEAMFFDSEDLSDWFDNNPPMNSVIHPQFELFWNEVWVGFIKHVEENILNN